jgi:hypothetical protein
MGVSFDRNAYYRAIVQKKPKFVERQVLFYSALSKPSLFKFESVSYREFLAQYNAAESARGFKKILEIPKAFKVGVLQNIYCVFRASLFLIKREPKAYLKIHVYIFIRNCEEGMGRIISIFHSRYGTYLIQDAQFQKKYYLCNDILYACSNRGRFVDKRSIPEGLDNDHYDGGIVQKPISEIPVGQGASYPIIEHYAQMLIDADKIENDEEKRKAVDAMIAPLFDAGDHINYTNPLLGLVSVSIETKDLFLIAAVKYAQKQPIPDTSYIYLATVAIKNNLAQKDQLLLELYSSLEKLDDFKINLIELISDPDFQIDLYVNLYLILSISDNIKKTKVLSLCLYQLAKSKYSKDFNLQLFRLCIKEALTLEEDEAFKTNLEKNPENIKKFLTNLFRKTGENIRIEHAKLYAVQDK